MHNCTTHTYTLLQFAFYNLPIFSLKKLPVISLLLIFPYNAALVKMSWTWMFIWDEFEYLNPLVGFLQDFSPPLKVWIPALGQQKPPGKEQEEP